MNDQKDRPAGPGMTRRSAIGIGTLGLVALFGTRSAAEAGARPRVGGCGATSGRHAENTRTSKVFLSR